MTDPHHASDGTAVTALVSTCTWVLLRLADPPAPSPLRPGRWWTWLQSAGTAAATLDLVVAATQLVAAWTALAAALHLAAAVTRWRPVEVLARVSAPRVVRRGLAAAVGVSVSTGAVLGLGEGALAGPTQAGSDDDGVAVIQRVEGPEQSTAEGGAPTADPPPATAPDPTTTSTAPRATTTAPGSPPPTTAVPGSSPHAAGQPGGGSGNPHGGAAAQPRPRQDPDRRARTPRHAPHHPEAAVATTTAPSPTSFPAPRTWRVERGDHLWHIAEADLARTGSAPTEQAVTAHWRAIIEANRSRLPDPGNPDLIHVGMEVLLPDPG